MAAVLEVILRGRDELSGTVGRAQVSLGSLMKTGAGLAMGFGGVEAAMYGVKNAISKSIGEAMAYEAQLAQIRALTGATKKDTDFLDEAIKDMAKDMPKSPAELGAGAYFILSSGITDAADASEVLEIAARASTVGLGETKVVADALTTVLNAYQMGAGEAGRVTDILMQAVKDGKAEADAFSGVLGRVVPIASQMGISFEEVAANLATFTRLGVSAEEAATGLRGVMSQLLQPSLKAKETLAGIGLTMQELREQVREKGLAASLQMLMERFKGNEEALAALFPDIRGLTNVLATAGVQGEAYIEILGNMGTATGNLDEGFKEIAETAQFKVKMAMQNLNLALVKLGEEALPAVVDLAEGVSELMALLGMVPGAAEDINLSASAVEKADASFNLWDATLSVLLMDFPRFQKEVSDLTGKTDVLGEAISRRTAVVKADLATMRESGQTTADVAHETSEYEAQVEALAVRLGLESSALLESGRSIDQLREETSGLRAEVNLLPGTWQAFDAEMAKGAQVMIDVSEAEAEAAPAADEHAQSVAGMAERLKAANAPLKEQLSLLDDITGQRTQETNALDIEINALAQEQNAAQQAELAQQGLGGAVESTADALDRQITALNNLAASMVPQALNDEIIALGAEATALQLTSAEIEAQLIPRQNLIDANQAQVDAIQAEIDAQESLLNSLDSTLEGLDKQIEAERELANERAGTLPQTLRMKELELEKAQMLNRVGGDVNKLTAAEKARLKEIEAGIEAERRSIEIRNLSADIKELEDQKSGKHLKALEAERAEVAAQKKALEEQLNTRKELITTLHPPELLAEIEALKNQKGLIDGQIAVIQNLQAQRELYKKTLVPPELLQEIDALGRQKGALDGINLSAVTRSESIGAEIEKLNLQRAAIDLVTEGWKLQGAAMLGLPDMPDIMGTLRQFKEMLLLQLRAAYFDALKAGDQSRMDQLWIQINEVIAMPFQHGGYVPAGVVTPAILHGPEWVIPESQMGGVGGRVEIHLAINSKYPPNRSQLREEVRGLLPEVRRALARGN